MARDIDRSINRSITAELPRLLGGGVALPPVLPRPQELRGGCWLVCDRHQRLCSERVTHAAGCVPAAPDASVVHAAASGRRVTVCRAVTQIPGHGLSEDRPAGARPGFLRGPSSPRASAPIKHSGPPGSLRLVLPRVVSQVRRTGPGVAPGGTWQGLVLSRFGVRLLQVSCGVGSPHSEKNRHRRCSWQGGCVALVADRSALAEGVCGAGSLRIAEKD